MNRPRNHLPFLCGAALFLAASAMADLQPVTFTLPKEGFWATKPKPMEAETVEMTSANSDSNYKSIGLEWAVTKEKLPLIRQVGLARLSNVLHVTGNAYGKHLYGMYGYSHQGSGEIATERDVWLRISGGEYDHVVGGSDGANDRAKPWTGDIVLELTGDAKAQTLSGGGLKGAEKNSRTGHVWVAITGNAQILGDAAGAHRVEGPASGTLTATGNATIYVSSLQGNNGNFTAGIDRTGSDASGKVVGDTALIVELPKTATGVFKKELRGGSYGAGSGTFAIEGNTSVRVSAPDSVTFSSPIYGASVSNTSVCTVSGDASVTLAGGTYTGIVAAGGYGAKSAVEGSATLTLASGVFKGTLAPAANGATVGGGSALVIAGEEGVVDLSAATLAEGFGSVTLRSGTLLLGERRLGGYTPTFDVPEGKPLALLVHATAAELSAGKAVLFPVAEGVTTETLPATLAVAPAGQPAIVGGQWVPRVEEGQLCLVLDKGKPASGVTPVSFDVGDDAYWQAKPAPKTAGALYLFNGVPGQDGDHISSEAVAEAKGFRQSEGLDRASNVIWITGKREGSGTNPRQFYGIYGWEDAPKTDAETLERDVWLKISSGAFDHVTAGSDGNSGNSKPIVGDLFVELTGDATANCLFGGGLKGGTRNSVTGNTRVVVAGKATVSGAIVGFHRTEPGGSGTATLTGNASVLVKSMQTEEGHIVGASDTNKANYAVAVEGHASVEIDLPSEAQGNFNKEIFGASRVDTDGTHTVASASVTITAPDTVTFTKPIAGGSCDIGKATVAKVTGDTAVTLRGGRYVANVVAGSYNAWNTSAGKSAVEGKATLTVEGGRFEGNAALLPAYNGGTVGASGLVIAGEAPIDLSRATLGAFDTVTLKGDLALGEARLSEGSTLAVEGQRTLALTPTAAELEANRVRLAKAEAVPNGLTVAAEGVESWALFVEDGVLYYGREAVEGHTWASGAGAWEQGLPNFKDGDNVTFARNAAQDAVALTKDVRVGTLTVAGDIALTGEGTLTAKAATLSGTLTLGGTLATTQGLTVSGTLGGTGVVQGKVTFAEGAKLRVSAEGPLTLEGEVVGTLALELPEALDTAAPALRLLNAADGVAFSGIPEGCAVRWVEGAYWLGQDRAMPFVAAAPGDWGTLAWQDADGQAVAANQWQTFPIAARQARLTGEGTVTLPEGLTLGRFLIGGNLTFAGATPAVDVIDLEAGCTLSAPESVFPTLPKLTGEGRYIKTGAGDLTISPGAQTSTPLEIAEGRLRFGAGNASFTYDVAHRITVASGATLYAEWNKTKLTSPDNVFTMEAGAQAELRVGGGGSVEGTMELDAEGGEVALHAAVDGGYGSVTLGFDVKGSGTLVLAEGLCDGWHNGYTLAGALSGAMALRAEDRNDVTLSGANTFTGGTELRRREPIGGGHGTGSEPKLIVASATALGTGPVRVGERTTLEVKEGVTLELASTLGGAGTVTGAVSLKAGASLDASQGCLTLGTLTAEAPVPVKLPEAMQGREVRLCAWAAEAAPGEGVTFTAERAGWRLEKRADGLYAVATAPAIPDRVADETEGEPLTVDAKAFLSAAAQRLGMETVARVTGRSGGKALTSAQLNAALRCFTGDGLYAAEGDTLTVAYDFGVADVSVKDGSVRATLRVQGAKGIRVAFAEGVTLRLRETDEAGTLLKEETLQAAPAEGERTLTFPLTKETLLFRASVSKE